jgi:hypothetical protein
MHFERFDLKSGDWSKQLERLPGAMVCQTPAWMSFLERSQHGEPIAALLWDGGSVVGAFAGMVVTKFGLRILGSPFPGWTTSYMGLTIADRVSRNAAIRALVEFAFDDLRCVHLEMMDRRLTLGDLSGLKARHRMYRSWEVDLNEDDDKLVGTFNQTCRRAIRTAARNGVVIEEAHDAGFVDEYYEQLRDVFARQRLIPTYPRDRVAQLISTLAPSGRLLLLRARTAQGHPAATGIFHAVDSQRAYGWGFASWRHTRHLHPNELLMLYAMSWWRARGFTIMDLGGSGDYKKKYHPRPIVVPWIQISKYAVIPPLRNAARGWFVVRQRIMGRLVPKPDPLPDEDGAYDLEAVIPDR